MGSTGKNKDTTSKTQKQVYLERAFKASMEGLSDNPEDDNKWDKIIRKKRQHNLEVVEDVFNDDMTLNYDRVRNRLGDVSHLDFKEQMKELDNQVGAAYAQFVNRTQTLARNCYERYVKYKDKPTQVAKIQKYFDTAMVKWAPVYGLTYTESINFLEFIDIMDKEIGVSMVRSRKQDKKTNTSENREEIKMSKKTDINTKVEEKDVAKGQVAATENKDVTEGLDLSALDDSTAVDSLFDDQEIPEDLIKKANEQLNDTDVNIPKVDGGVEKTARPKTDAEKEVEKQRKAVQKEIDSEIKEILTSPLNNLSMSESATKLKTLKRLNSQHVVSYGFFTRHNEKIVPRIKVIKPKKTDADEKANEYEFEFRNQKPSKATHGIINGPRVLLDSLDTALSESKLKEYSSVGLELSGEVVDVGEKQAKDRVTVCLPIKALTAYLMSLTELEGIKEAPELTDLVFGSKQNENGSMYEGTTIMADYSTYVKNKMALLHTQKEVARYTANPSLLPEGTTIADLNTKAQTLQKRVTSKEQSNNIATVKASTRSVSRLVTRKNFIPTNRYKTINPFTTSIDLVEPTTKRTYADLLSQSVTCDSRDLLNSAVVCADKNHIKFFEPTDKVSIKDKEDLFNKSVSGKNHWYTGKPLSKEQINVVVRFPKVTKTKDGSTKQTFKAAFESLNFTDDTSISTYTLDKVDNQAMLELIGAEKLKDFVVSNNLVASKASGGLRKRRGSKINRQILEAMGADILSKMKVDFEINL